MVELPEDWEAKRSNRLTTKACIAWTRFVSSSQCGDMVGEFLPWHRVQITRCRCYDCQNRLNWCVKSEVSKESIPVPWQPSQPDGLVLELVAPEKEKELVILRDRPAKKIPLPALIRHFGDKQFTAPGTA